MLKHNGGGAAVLYDSRQGFRQYGPGCEPGLELRRRSPGSFRARHNKRWPSAFDLIKLTTARVAYQRYEGALARAEKARNKNRARATHARITSARRHHLHEHSTRIVAGDVNARKMAQTRMIKSVLEASWSSFRLVLCYQAMTHGGCNMSRPTNVAVPQPVLRAVHEAALKVSKVCE